MSLRTYVPSVEDAIVDETLMSTAQLAYGVRSVRVQQQLAALLDLLQEHETDGLYYGEEQQFVGRIENLVSILGDTLKMLAEDGKAAAADRCC